MAMFGDELSSSEPECPQDCSKAAPQRATEHDGRRSDGEDGMGVAAGVDAHAVEAGCAHSTLMGVVYSEEEREADQGASAAPGGNAAATTTTFPAALPLPALAAPAGRKTLVLDLDGTLIASEELSTLRFPWGLCSTRTPDYEALGRRVWLRPGVRQFLEAVRPHFEVVLFTAATSGWAKAALDHLDPAGRLFDVMLHRQHTVSDLAWEYVKDIGRLGRDLANVVIVDDNAAMFMYQPRNALHVQAYEVARRSAASACRAAGLYREAEEQHEGSESEDGDDVLARVEGILLQQVLPAADVRSVLGPMADTKTIVMRSTPGTAAAATAAAPAAACSTPADAAMVEAGTGSDTEDEEVAVIGRPSLWKPSRLVRHACSDVGAAMAEEDAEEQAGQDTLPEGMELLPALDPAYGIAGDCPGAMLHDGAEGGDEGLALDSGDDARGAGAAEQAEPLLTLCGLAAAAGADHSDVEAMGLHAGSAGEAAPALLLGAGMPAPLLGAACGSAHVEDGLLFEDMGLDLGDFGALPMLACEELLAAAEALRSAEQWDSRGHGHGQGQQPAVAEGSSSGAPGDVPAFACAPAAALPPLGCAAAAPPAAASGAPGAAAASTAAREPACQGREGGAAQQPDPDVDDAVEALESAVNNVAGEAHTRRKQQQQRRPPLSGKHGRGDGCEPLLRPRSPQRRRLSGAALSCGGIDAAGLLLPGECGVAGDATAPLLACALWQSTQLLAATRVSLGPPSGLGASSAAC